MQKGNLYFVGDTKKWWKKKKRNYALLFFFSSPSRASKFFSSFASVFYYTHTHTKLFFWQIEISLSVSLHVYIHVYTYYFLLTGLFIFTGRKHATWRSSRFRWWGSSFSMIHWNYSISCWWIIQWYTLSIIFFIARSCRNFSWTITIMWCRYGSVSRFLRPSTRTSETEFTIFCITTSSFMEFIVICFFCS